LVRQALPSASSVARALLAAVRLTPAAAAMLAVVPPSGVAASAARTASTGPPAAGLVPGCGPVVGVAPLGGVAGVLLVFLPRAMVMGSISSRAALFNACYPEFLHDDHHSTPA
jgi:hypothetical protein